MVTNLYIGVGIFYKAGTVIVLEIGDTITCGGIGINRYIDEIGIRGTVGHIAGDAVCERCRATESEVQGNALAVTLGNGGLPYCSRSLRRYGNGEGSVVCAIVCGCNHRSYKSIYNQIGKSLVGVPRTGLRQVGSIARADYGLVADHNGSAVGGSASLAIKVGERFHFVVCTYGRTHADHNAVGVRDAVGSVAGETVVERRRTGEIYLQLGRLTAADTPNGIFNGNRRNGIYSHFELCPATQNQPCIAVASMTGFCCTPTCGVGEGCAARYCLGIGKIVVAVEQTSGGIVACCGRCIYISRATAGATVGRRGTAAVPAAAATVGIATANTIATITKRSSIEGSAPRVGCSGRATCGLGSSLALTTSGKIRSRTAS